MKLNILHLEDNPDDVELVRHALRRQSLDCEIERVANGPAYLSALSSSKFDVILSDSGLPGYDGHTALAVARTKCPGVPFIVLSGNAEPLNPAESDETEGVAARLAKCDLTRLGPAIRDALALSNAPARAPSSGEIPPPAEAPPRSMQQLQSTIENLEQQLATRTQELHARTLDVERLNRELEGFSYSVAHDLRAPLVTIDGFSQLLLERADTLSDGKRHEYIERISGASRRLHNQIEGLLSLSKLLRVPMQRTLVDLSGIAREIVTRLKEHQPEREVDVRLEDGLTANGDARLLRIALECLLSNAWKFTSRRAHPVIAFASGTEPNGALSYFVRDNGIGFDAPRAKKLFAPFQRFHAREEFPGTGIGLATAHRAVLRHGGKIWAESQADQGATFRFTLAL